MLGQRRRWWANIKLTWDQCLLFPDMYARTEELNWRVLSNGHAWLKTQIILAVQVINYF